MAKQLNIARIERRAAVLHFANMVRDEAIRGAAINASAAHCAFHLGGEYSPFFVAIKRIGALCLRKTRLWRSKTRRALF